MRERFAVLAREILTVEIGAAVESGGEEEGGGWPHGRRRCMPRDEWTHKLRRSEAGQRASEEAIKFEISIPDRTTLSSVRPSVRPTRPTGAPPVA